MSLSKIFPCFQFRVEDNINKLDYSNNILCDGFPQVWLYERTLEELNVTSTRINYLPPQLFYCQGLKVLLANNNNLENIPEAIGSLRQLQELNLSRNFISSVPDNVKSCKNLTHLDLSSNALQKLPDAITCLISLQELILNETYLEFLPANFGRLVNLRIVELRSNNLVSLPRSIQRLTNLQRLDIGCNEFSKMPEVIGELKQLRELWFDFNQIETLPPQIGKLRELIHLEAIGNCLVELPNEIGNCRNLEILSVSMNNITTLPFSIGLLRSLITLKSESNKLIEIPGCISNLENLEELVLSHNKLLYLPSTIGMLRKLRYLFADDNNLQKLPEEICSCSVLTVFSVSQNKISALPDNIGHLSNLKVLNIVQNSIITLPVTLLSLVNLKSLWISRNQSQPLIPLQYSETANKTQLTCFMLPQLDNEDKVKYFNKHGLKEKNSINQIEDKAASGNASKRKICFADETILDTYIQTHSASSTKNTIPIISTACSNHHILTGNKVSLVSESKDFLMRSPTPYPKELRLMAKYVQLNHKKHLNIGYNENEAIKWNENSHNNMSSLQNTENEVVKSESISQPTNITLNDQTEQHRSTEDDQNRQPHTYLSTNSLSQCVIIENVLKPPPYHIARCFTKKTVEDLTKYEFTRKQQEQNHNFHNSMVSTQNSQLSQKTNIELKTRRIPDKSEINLDYQNLMSQQLEQTDLTKKCHKKAEETDIKTVILDGQHRFLDCFDAPQSSNILSNKKGNKTRSKWLFGVHKNPRVLQVNICWQNGRDFEIDTLPNKEGIFVVSTVPESNASKIIYPCDKLLEVEGVDFTNINLNEARQVLFSSRPSISIMLSRK